MGRKETIELLNTALCVGLRQDSLSSESNLQIAGFNAMRETFDKSNVPGIQEDIVGFIPKLLNIINQPSSVDLQNLVLQAMQSLVIRIPEQLLTEQITDSVVNLMISICKQRQNISEEALYTCSGIALNIGEKFDKYMTDLGPLVFWAMKQVEMTSVCKCGMNVCGDLARSLQNLMEKYAVQFVPALVEALQSTSINRYTKLIVITTLGDISMAIKGGFLPYIGPVFGVLQSACQMSLQDTQDPELIDYLEKLRESLVECYTGVLSGLVDVGRQADIQQTMPMIIKFLIDTSAKQQNFSFLSNITGLLGDIACAYQQAIKQYLQVNEVVIILQKLKQSSSQDNKDLAYWTENMITRL